MEIRDVDVLIVGGGLVGCSLACALAPLGLAVALVDAPARPVPLDADPRKLALAAGSLKALAALGVLGRLAAPPAPITRIHASREGDFGRVLIEAAEFGRTALGGVVLAGDLGRALQQAMAAVPSITVLEGIAGMASSADVDLEGRRAVSISPADGSAPQHWRARLVVAADGTASPLRAAAGIEVDEYDYGQTLVVTSLRMDSAPDGTAYERLTANGPVALLPMAGGRYGALCAVPRGDANAVLALDDAGFAAMFQRRFGWRAGRVRDVGTRSAWPLRRVVAERLFAERLVLVGNAAQSLHPIGAQGFNLGLRDALSLADALSDALAGDAAADAGSAALLADYAGRRSEDRERTLAFSDGLARVSASESPLHRIGRSLGLLALQVDAGLRAQLAGGAMGFRGRVPRLMREDV